MITDPSYNYNNTRYEYDKDGNKTSTQCIVIEKKIPTKDKIIPTTIFAQNGVLRNVYKWVYYWDIKDNLNYEFFSNLFGDTLDADVENIETKTYWLNKLIRPEIINNDLKTTYINPRPASYNCQGIGSGAGYIEVSNGTYTIDSTLN